MMAKCKYCDDGEVAREGLFCSYVCRDNYDCAVAVNRIKTPIMEAMHTMGRGDVKREILFLEDLMRCLKYDLEDRKHGNERP